MTLNGAHLSANLATTSRWRLLLALLLLAATSATLTVAGPPQARGASTLPAGFQESVVFSGLTNPTAVRFAADGRVFVAEKSGRDQGLRRPDRHHARPRSPTSTQRAQLLGPRAARHGARPELPGRARTSTSSTRTTTARIGGRRAALGHAGRASDACPTPPGATATAASVSGRLSRLQANGNTMTGASRC